ncbi:MAG TPA: DNA helicase RecQ [Balneola sp.]|nr:DNA helicase RecQ [Balneola sp.]
MTEEKSVVNKEYTFSKETDLVLKCAMKVHSEIGDGFQEVIYQRALADEMNNVSLRFNKEKEFPVFYQGSKVGSRSADFVVFDKILVELKSIDELEQRHYSQALNYLKAFGLEVGLLINFGAPSLQWKRVITNRKAILSENCLNQKISDQKSMQSVINEAKSILKETFGYEDFRLQQEQAINQVLHKKDALVIMPTGGGKSICYQIPAMMFDGLTIVISPLISLMKDQVDQLREYGIDAVYLNSSLRPEVYDFNVRKIISGKVKMLYVAPETLMMEKTREMLSNLKVDCFTIDEAHCISEWGHDFRPEYRQIAALREDFPDAVCMALTATATPRVQEDIKNILKFDDSEEFISSFDRDNLFLKVVDKKDPVNQLLDFLFTRKKQSGIIYCFSRRQVDELSETLEDEGYSVKPYHAGLSDGMRAGNQRAFIKDDVQIIVATIAFGMGINKSNVRFIVHYDMPQNIESYYQQIGRAGRDGLRADCLLLYGSSDTQKIQYFINKKKGQEREVAEKHLKQLKKYLESLECRRKPLMAYFGETYPNDECGMCDNCLSVDDDVEDLTIQAQQFLSTIIRSGEKFGATHIADILRGSKAKKVLENEHEKLSTYGIGLEFSKDQWMQISKMLLRQDYISKGEFGGLKLEKPALAVLDGTENVFGTMDRSKTSLEGEAVVRTSSEIENEYDEALFDILRLKRKELADEQDIPPYAVFPDTTLVEMAYFYPQSKESLEPLYGVGSVKKEKYGDTFVGVIKNYAAEHGKEEKKKSIAKQIKRKTGGQKFEIIGEAFNAGQSIELLAEEHGVKDMTILKHLKDFLDDGNKLRLEGLLEASELSLRQRDQVMKSFDKKNPLMLRPVYDDLDKKIGYDELRVMQLYYLAKEKQ